MWRNRLVVSAMVLAAMGCRPTTLFPTVDRQLVAAEAAMQRELAVSESVAASLRLADIAYRLSHANADLCDRTRFGGGMTIASPASFASEDRAAARNVFGLRDEHRILGVVPGSAADRAGLSAGDVIVALGAWRPPPPAPAAFRERRSPVIEKLAELAQSGAALGITVERGGVTLTRSLTPDVICNYEVSVAHSEQVNAFADGARIVVTSGMMRFARDDIELATVVGHELAHNAMRHHDAKLGNGLIGVVIDALLGLRGVDTQGQFTELAVGVFSQEFESEADYVGLYAMRRAGYRIDDAPNFWRRMAVLHPAAISASHTASHPPTPQRFLALERTVQEIRAKEAGGARLVPERKRGE